MFPGSSLLVTIVLALSVAANPLFNHQNDYIRRSSPVITLQTARHFNFTGTAKLLDLDRARVAGLKNLASPKKQGGIHPDTIVGSVPATNQANQYVVDVNIGSPATTYTLLVDIASSNTWVGADQTYIQTGTTVQTQDTVAVTYGTGSMSGTEFNDRLAIGSALTIVGQSIGVATDVTGFSGVDGIMGLGPNGLTVGTLTPDTNQIVPTLTDSLFAQAVIQQNLLAVSFEPTNTLSITNGELTFGGTDSSKFVGSINFAPITTTSPASRFFGIDQAIHFGQGSSTPILSKTAGIFDTLTTLTMISSDAFARYQTATGAVLDDATTLLKLTPAQFSNLKSLFFTINNVDFEFTADAQTWPRALNTAIGGDANSVYLIIANLNTPTGQGFDFVNGFTFLERFYTVYDTGSHRVGIANTPFTRATSNQS
ncbi:peptidase A1 family protein [Abortiporus biennis]